MGEVVTFENVTPAARYDEIPWETVRVEESATQDGSWTSIDTITLSPVDVDPADPAARSFTTANGTDVGLWYRLVFIDGNSDESLPTIPLQNAETIPDIADTPYATTDELARILKIRNATDEQTAAMERVLEAAALEINAELGRSEAFTDPPPGLIVEVNLERAVEHWQQQEIAFGIIGLGGESVPIVAARDSWDRHAHKLAPLKASWGIG